MVGLALAVSKVFGALRAAVRRIYIIINRYWLNLTCLNVKLSTGVEVYCGARLRATDGGSIAVSENAQISNGAQLVAQRGSIQIAESVFIGSWTTITSKASVTIGRNALIAERVTIRDQDHAIHGDVNIPINQAGFEVAPIVIGDDVWIGAGAVILKGVTIGRGAVVAANAVVNRDVAEYEIVGGVPAKHIGFRKGHRPDA